jgi:hypothetical protein
MKILAFAILISTPLLVAGSSHAAPAAIRFHDVLRGQGGTITVPPEWAGIWAYTDSVFDCSGALQNVDTGQIDTLCAGQSVYVAEEGGPQSFDCTGTADATTVDVTCTGSEPVFEGCDAVYVVELTGTRTADTYTATSTLNLTYSGTGEGCDLIPPFCQRVKTVATRTGPAPEPYCSSPTRETTWGQVKARYR